MSDLHDLKDDILEDGLIDDEEVARLREILYADDEIDRQEANLLFELNDATVFSDNSDDWGELFVEAVASHVLEDEESPGVVDGEEARWLIDSIEGDDRVDDNEIALLVHIADEAAGEGHERLVDFTLEATREAVLADGVIDDEEVDQIESIVYGAGGASGSRVDRDEANFLFDLNDAVSGADNSDAWTELFVEAVASHVLEDEDSPGALDEEEAEWLVDRIEGDDTYDETERRLVAHLEEHAEAIPDTVDFDFDLS